MQNLTAPIPTRAELGRLTASAVSALMADGIDGDHVRSWDVTGDDEAVKALAEAVDAGWAAEQMARLDAEAGAPPF